MNKKGFIGIGSNFMFGTLGLFFVILFATILIGFQHGAGDADAAITSFDNLQEKLHAQFDPRNITESEYNNTLTFSLMKVVYSSIDFVVYSTFEVAKMTVRFAYENQDFVNPEVLMYLVFLALLAPIIIPLVKLCIIIFLLIKEYLTNKKEKKELEKIKNEST